MKVVTFTLFCLFIAYEAKVYSICDFYYALKPLGLDPFKGIFAEQYLCAADQSSKLDTFYYENIDGVPRYGIFQLSGLEWCDNGRHSSQNKCHTLCDNFLDDNITDDALCVKTIVNSTKDMSAWPLYGKYCDEGRVNRYYIKCLFGGVTQRRKYLLRNLP